MNEADIVLDDRDFQSLVDEARRRIVDHCPEWTEHNVSDPGMTLIEQFAWMTEILLYRVNRLPEKVHLALLSLLDVRLTPPSASQVALRFRLTDTPGGPVQIAAGMEAATAPDGDGRAIVFRTVGDVTVPMLSVSAAAAQRDGDVAAVSVRNGIVSPGRGESFAFANPPVVGDAFMLGFDTPLDELLLRLDVDATPARGSGIDPRRPPWAWEVSRGHDGWAPAEVTADSTGGFNYGSGSVEIQVRGRSEPVAIAGKHLHWLRCRLAAPPRPDPDAADAIPPPPQPPPAYKLPPRLHRVSVTAVGVLVTAEHAELHRGETVGYSDGTPNQTFRLRHAPALPAGEDEYLEVGDPSTGEWTAWEPQETLAGSGATDEHYRFDPATAEIQLGPATRVPGGWAQHGAVPPRGAPLRMTAYRHGGGRDGDVAANTLTVLRRAVPGVATVTNPEAARGGADAETRDGAAERAALELQTRHRAVTARDFEVLARNASARVARARCLTPQPGQAIPMYVLPRADDPAGFLEWRELEAPHDLRIKVASYLDARCLLGTNVHVTPVAFKAATVAVEVKVDVGADAARVERDILAALTAYINPHVGGPDRRGWPWGRPLRPSELHPVVSAVEGVASIVFLRLYETDPKTMRPADSPVEDPITLPPAGLMVSGRHAVHAAVRKRP